MTKMIACAALCAACAGLPALAGSAHAAAGVQLRYHFVPGMAYGYRLSGVAHESLTPQGQAAQTVDLKLRVDLSFHIGAVAPDGTADAIMHSVTRYLSLTMLGSTSVVTSAQVQVQSVQLGPDNHFDTEGANNMLTSFGPWGLQAVGSLPSAPVAPGARWISTARQNVDELLDGITTGSLPPATMSAQTVFVGYRVVDHQRAAELLSTGTVQFRATSSGAKAPGSAVAVHAVITERLHSFFSLTARRMLATTVSLDQREYARSLDGKKVVRTHETVTVSLMPNGW